jgi:hypothetical protein
LVARTACPWGLIRATKTRSGVCPAGAVLVSTFFWKILVTPVNRKMRRASDLLAIG